MTVNPTDLVAFLGNLRVIVTVSATMALGFIVVGALDDARARLTRRRMSRIGGHLSTVLFGSDEQAADAAEKLAVLPRSMILLVTQRLAADLDGDADDRLRTLIAVTGSTRRVSRLVRSRRWRSRAQAAALCPLLPLGDPRRTVLLHDPHPIVRARAAEHLERVDVADNAPRLLALLDDQSDAVRFAAQHALLQGDGRIVAPLGQYLAETDGPGIVWALEIAGSLRHPRLAESVAGHVRSEDPRRRAMAARSLVPRGDGRALIASLLEDDEPGVRAAAVTSAGQSGGEVLAAAVGRLLGDHSWEVRQQSGLSLASLGAVGALVLRRHLGDGDPFARDMARRVLDDIEARGGRAVNPAPIPGALDPFPSAVAA